MWVDEQVIDVSPNEWYFLPRGSVHTFWNGTNETLRFIGMYFHQNFEDYHIGNYFTKSFPIW